MPKYHTNNEGEWGLCLAEIKCRFGGESGLENHYDTPEEAKAASREIMKEKYGPLSNMSGKKIYNEKDFKSNTNFFDEIENSESRTNQVYNILKNIDINTADKRGLDFECYAATEYAERLNLERTAVFDGNELVDIDGIIHDKHDEIIIEEAREKLLDYYENNLGIKFTQKEKDSLCRAIYFSENNHEVIVQTGANNTLDCAVINANGVKIIEAKKTLKGSVRIEGKKTKKTHGGAQIKSKEYSINEKGFINHDDLDSNYQKEIKEQIVSTNINEALGKNVELDVSPEIAMKHFVELYQREGGEMLISSDSNGKVEFSDLSGDSKDVAERLIQQGKVAKVIMRANHTKKNMTDTDYSRIMKSHNCFLKDGKMKDKFSIDEIDFKPSEYNSDLIKMNPEFRQPRQKTYTLDAINRGPKQEYIRFGEVIVPYTRKDYEKACDYKKTMDLCKKIDEKNKKGISLTLKEKNIDMKRKQYVKEKYKPPVIDIKKCKIFSFSVMGEIVNKESSTNKIDGR